MKYLSAFMLMALAFIAPSIAQEPAPTTSLKDVQAAFVADLTAIKSLYMTKLKPQTHADRVRGDGIMWVKLLSEPVTMEIATGTVNSGMSDRAKFEKLIKAFERGRDNAKALGSVEGNKLAGAIDPILKIIAELKKNPQAHSQEWPAKAKDLLVYLR